MVKKERQAGRAKQSSSPVERTKTPRQLVVLHQILVVWCISLFGFSAWSQGSFEIGQVDGFDVDVFLNIYAVRGEEVVQYDQSGNELNRFSNKSLGPIQSIDASNPHKILLFYQELSTIVFLDNKMGERSESLYLQNRGMEQSIAACHSYNNGVWIYDQIYPGLRRLNSSLEEDVNTGSLAQMLGQTILPEKMQEQGKWLYVNDPEKGILVFDIFGAYSKKIPLMATSDFQVEGDKLYFLKGGKLFFWDLLALEEGVFRPELESVTYFRIRENRLFVVADGLLKIIRL